VVALNRAEMDALAPCLPWRHELDRMAELFDRIDPGAPDLRTACFALLWLARELSLGRHPLWSSLLGR
jgi:hypothetical protein